MAKRRSRQRLLAGPELGRKLKRARLAQGLSLRSVASRAGLTDHMHLWRVEAGKTSPLLGTLRKILVALRIKYEDLEQ